MLDSFNMYYQSRYLLLYWMKIKIAVKSSWLVYMRFSLNTEEIVTLQHILLISKSSFEYPLFLQFLSMKLATVNPRLDINIDGVVAKDVSVISHYKEIQRSCEKSVYAYSGSNTHNALPDSSITSWSIVDIGIFFAYARCLSSTSYFSSRTYPNQFSCHREL